MSATNRGAVRNAQDYYVTPQKTISDFLKAFIQEQPRFTTLRCLDPCAGGDAANPMAYPTALERLGIPIDTMDIRPDSRAAHTGNYLEQKMYGYGCIITNPPYNLATQFIEKALEDVAPGGYVIMLLRLNFFGAQKRNKFFQRHMPLYTFIHSERPNFFTPEMKAERKLMGQNTGTDATEYAHFVWQKGANPTFSKTTVI